MYGLFGKMKSQPGKRDELLALLLVAGREAPEMPGCLVYIVNSDPNDPDGIWVYEVWRTQADHQASLNLDSVKTLIAAARPLIAGFGERFEVMPLGGKGLPPESQT
jgi:quinol monooxygenase YgiN